VFLPVHYEIQEIPGKSWLELRMLTTAMVRSVAISTLMRAGKSFILIRITTLSSLDWSRKPAHDFT
jgi:hypothetical protein